MAKNTYEDTMREWVPQQRNLFELTIVGLDTFLDGGILALSLNSCALPREETEKITVPYLNTEMYFAGKTTIGEFATDFRDYCDQNTIDAILAWRRTVVTHYNHRSGLPADYKKTATLKMFSPDFDTGPTYIRSWELKGVWPMNHDLGTASMDDTGQLMISVTIVADKVEPGEGFSS